MANKHRTNLHFLVIALACISAAGVWKLWNDRVNNFAQVVDKTHLLSSTVFPGSIDNKTVAEQFLPSSNINGWDTKLTAVFQDKSLAPGLTVTAQAYVYKTQKQGKEMISSSNTLLSKSDVNWRLGESLTIDSQNFINKGDNFQIKQYLLTSNRHDLLLWRWYSVNSVFTGSEYYAKWLEFRNKIFLKSNLSITYLLMTKNTGASSKALLEISTKNIVGSQ